MPAISPADFYRYHEWDRRGRGSPILIMSPHQDDSKPNFSTLTISKGAVSDSFNLAGGIDW